MQEWLPMPVLRQIVGRAFRQENVTGVAAIHYPLRHVDAGAGDVRPLVYVGHFIDRSAVNPHPQLQFWVLLIRATEFERALGRRFRAVAKNQRHSIAGCEPDQFPFRFSGADLFRIAHHSLQMFQQFGLLVDEQLRITHDVYEEHVPDLGFEVRGRIRRHGISFLSESAGLNETISIQDDRFLLTACCYIAPLQRGEEVVDLHCFGRKIFATSASKRG
ncbi:MAG: hypothetical protein ABI217_00885 [Chthoniobacterales bacterium]